MTYLQRGHCFSEDVKNVIQLFHTISEQQIGNAKQFRKHVITQKGGSAIIAKKCLGWVYAATMENMIAFQARAVTDSDQIITVAAAMFLRQVDFEVPEGESFETHKTNEDFLYYEKNYKPIIERSVMYQDYFMRMNCTWPDLAFVKL
jgi:hypothetical protein